MDSKPTSFNEYVTRGILANNQFGIAEVNTLESLKSVFFVKEEYGKIEKFIKAGNIEAIKTFHEKQPRTGENLDVMEFKDQNEKKFIVTTYDSNLLEQDPQVIEIYSL